MKLLYFYKHDCQPCAEKKPIAEEIASAAGVELQYADVEQGLGRVFARSYRVKSVPTLVVVGDQGGRLAGFTGKLINKESVLRFFGK